MRTFWRRVLDFAWTVGVSEIPNTAVAATPGQPLSPVEIANSVLVHILGLGPTGAYIAYAVVLYAAAAVWIGQMRKTLETEWVTLASWRDEIILVCASVDGNKPDVIQHASLGANRLYRGKVVLAGLDSADAILQSNRRLIRVARLGEEYIRRTRLLYAGITFATMAVCQTVVTLVLLLIDKPNFDQPGYVPTYQFILAAIFLWPVALFFFEHERVPKWKRDLTEAKRNNELVHKNYGFAEGHIAL